MENNETFYNRSIYTALRIGFIALLFVWSFEIIKPFILPVLWGIIIAVAIFPLFERLSKLNCSTQQASNESLEFLLPIYGFFLSIVDDEEIFIGYNNKKEYRIERWPVDFAVPKLKIIIEYDGYFFHPKDITSEGVHKVFNVDFDEYQKNIKEKEDAIKSKGYHLIRIDKNSNIVEIIKLIKRILNEN